MVWATQQETAANVSHKSQEPAAIEQTIVRLARLGILVNNAKLML